MLRHCIGPPGPSITVEAKLAKSFGGAAIPKVSATLAATKCDSDFLSDPYRLWSDSRPFRTRPASGTYKRPSVRVGNRGDGLFLDGCCAVVIHIRQIDLLAEVLAGQDEDLAVQVALLGANTVVPD
jgi:hypothetical protein